MEKTIEELQITVDQAWETYCTVLAEIEKEKELKVRPLRTAWASAKEALERAKLKAEIVAEMEKENV